MTAADELIEKDAIRELKARYFRYMDTKNWGEWRRLFTDDMAADVELCPTKAGDEAFYAPIAKGGDGFVQMMRDRSATVSTVHHGHMPEIVVTGPDTARGIWAMEDVVDDFAGSLMRGFGHYHEEYRKVEGQWRIARLRLTRLRVDYLRGVEPTREQLAAIAR